MLIIVYVCMCDLIIDCLRVMEKKPNTTIKPSSKQRDTVVPMLPLTTESGVLSSNNSISFITIMHTHIHVCGYYVCIIGNSLRWKSFAVFMD